MANKIKTSINFKLNLANQILAGYSVIILVAVVASLFCVSSLRSNQAIDQKINQINLPFYLSLKELSAVTSEMNKLTNSWIYQPNPIDKKRLLTLINETYPNLDKNINGIVDKTEGSNIDSLTTLLSELKDLSQVELSVTSLLKADSLYSSDVIVDEAIQLLEKSIDPKTAEISIALLNIVNDQEKKIAEAQLEKEKSYSTLTLLLLLMITAFIVTTIAAYFNVRKRIVSPIVSIKDLMVELGRGKIVTMEKQERRDEVGQMHNAMVNLTRGVSAKSTFASHIGEGKYDEQFELLSADDSMGQALLTMRDNLRKSAEEERKRNWAVAGLAKFGELLRNQDQDLKKFGDQVLSFTIRYIKANQGRLYVVNDDSKDKLLLELISCYAWDKKKFMQQKLEQGEGLTGQCWVEGRPIYMTKIPEDYVKITSGLGLANPRNIFIVPLTVNEACYGVLELASFNVLQDFEQEFIMKLSESLASAISTVRINEKTKTLLAQTQQQAEEMRSQEEEMRQNMEELTATQEEMIRKEREYVKRIEMLEKNQFAEKV